MRSVGTKVTLVLLALQAALVVTGGAVRLTGSGLGCPTWPECTKGSYTPVEGQAEGALHAWIEFGNRLLTFALILSAAVVFILVLRKGRRDLRLLAAGQVLGIFGQGILGGITVLTKLNPIPVAGHFLLSIVLIAGATSLHEFRSVQHVKRMNFELKHSLMGNAHLYLTIAVLILGTVVTGSGPHAGDIQAPRFPFSIHNVARQHAFLVVALLALSFYMYFKGSFSDSTRKRIALFIVIALSQGLIGTVQYFQGVPQLLVGAHLLGASLLWIAAWRIRNNIFTEPVK